MSEKEKKANPQHDSLFLRLHRALGPILGGLILDFVDLATFGPIGLLGGFVVAGAVGWWLAGLYEFSQRGRWLMVGLAALYSAVPFTEPLPIATFIGAMARFREHPRTPPSADGDAHADERGDRMAGRQENR